MKHATRVPAAHSFTTNRLPARLIQDQSSPNGRAAGWVAENEWMSYPVCSSTKVLPLPLSLSPVLLVPSASRVLLHRPPLVSMELPKDYVKEDLEPHLSLRQYFPWVLDFTWFTLDCSKSSALLVFPPGILFSFLKIPSSPSPEVRLNPWIWPRHCDPISTGTGHSHRKGLHVICDSLLRYAHLSFLDVAVTVIMNH